MKYEEWKSVCETRWKLLQLKSTNRSFVQTRTAWKTWLDMINDSAVDGDRSNMPITAKKRLNVKFFD